jgi:thiamine biosynthesis protein ThiI
VKGILLLSGGIDSPVAGRMVQDQGMELEALHCSFEPLTGPESVEKAKDLAKLLGLNKLHVARIGEVLSTIPSNRDAHRHYFILQKRLFYRLAGRVAVDSDSTVIVTGENLGQVSSQTLSNLATLEAAAPIPIIRPLLGLDKNDIIRWARDYGTYETSIGPELCDLLGPDKPATKSDAERVAGLEDEVGMDVESIGIETITL